MGNTSSWQETIVAGKAREVRLQCAEIQGGQEHTRGLFFFSSEFYSFAQITSLFPKRKWVLNINRIVFGKIASTMCVCVCVSIVEYLLNKISYDFLIYSLFNHVCSVAQSCLTLCDPMDGSLPGSSVHGLFQARILEWVAISFCRGSSWPRGQTWVSCINRWILYHLSQKNLKSQWSGVPN